MLNRSVIDYYYTQDDALKRLLLQHSEAVARKALAICDKHPELGMDRAFVELAAMSHDIGVVECDAPGIHCHGWRHYIQHGLAGAEMLRKNPPGSLLKGMEAADAALVERLARVCQRHTGAGITRSEVVAQGLPLPLPDDGSEPYMPETLEEKLVCYADKFFSKSKPDREKAVGEAERSLAKFGEEGLVRFRQWEKMFS